MGVLDKKGNFKDISIPKESFSNQKSKRNKVYAFYCTQEELDELKLRAEQKHLNLSEYFRMKLFSSD